MFRITKKEYLTDTIISMDILAPRVVKSAKIGQFIIVRIDEKGERIPLTIADINHEEQTVNIVFQVVGNSTKKMSSYNEGDFFMDFVGPLGTPSDLINKTKDELNNMNIVFIAGGVGAAPIYPQAKYLHNMGVDFDVIIGTRSKSTLILDEKFKKISKNLYISTDDGSYGFHGNCSNLLEDLIKNHDKKYKYSVVIGPLIMMKFTVMSLKKYNIKNAVSLSPMMLDGTGMCGACRVSVAGETKFTCVDGPEFNGYDVDFDQAMKRLNAYKKEEAKKLSRNI